MKVKHVIILTSLAFGGVFWVIDALLDYYFFYSGETFLGLLIWDVPRREVYSRSVISACFGAIGAITERAFAARRRAAEALRKSEESERQLKNLSSHLFVAHEEERRRIALDVHDSLSSQLSAIKFMVERSIQKIERGGGPTEWDFLREVLPVIREAIEEVRRIQGSLRPSILDDLGILATINWFCRGFQDLYPDLRVEQHLSAKEEEVPEPLKIAIFRIMQEALSNVGKHGKADRATVRLAKQNDAVELRIEDNGQGFVPTGPARWGGGLMSMREHAQVSGGVCFIESATGKGTTVRVQWRFGEKDAER